MEQQQVQDTIKLIKRGFSLQMNGVASASMREKGIGGYLNWGIQLPALRNIAQQYGKDYDLAAALWKENVRECKILATLIMPAERMSSDLVDLWMEQTTTQEMAEYATFNLFQYTDSASLHAFAWIASDKAIAALADNSMAVRHAANNSLVAFADMGELQEKIVEAAMRKCM